LSEQRTPLRFRFNGTAAAGPAQRNRRQRADDRGSEWRRVTR